MWHLWNMKIFQTLGFVGIASLMGACGLIKESALDTSGPDLPAFGQELSFFSKYNADIVLLGDENSLVAVSPKYQGRVMTSTFGGAEGASLGWINHRLVADEKASIQSDEVGGEDTFGIGPEGGDFSVFFPAGATYSSENWRAPESFSSEPWKLTARSKTQARFEKFADFENAKGKRFKVKAEREITVLNRPQVSEILGIEIPDAVKLVAFQSFNKLTNAGDAAWTPESGLLNMNVQSCFNANRKVRVFVPYRTGDAAKLGDIVRDNYFEASSGDGSLLVDPSYVEFKVDGRNMSGIGISGRRSEGIAVSFDAYNKILTVILYIKPSGNCAYLQNAWRRSGGDRFDGDAISVYNNGPLARTSAAADRFYEITTYSPALELGSGKSQFHLQRTFHFGGSEYDLGLISYKLTGIAIGQLRGEKQ